MNGKNARVRERDGVVTGLIGLFLNILLGVGKLLVGLFSGSAAIISDAANNLSDAGSSLVTVSSFLLGGRKADKDHPYGHGRYEYIAGLLIGVIIIVVGFEFALSAIGKIINPQAIKIGTLMIVVMSLSIVIKLFMALFYGYKAKRLHSTALKAAAADSFFDCLVTGGVLIGIALTTFLPNWVDGAVALAVSAIILFGGFKILVETINGLLGKSDKEMGDKIRKLIVQNPQIIGAHDLRVHDYGPNAILASVHAEFDRNTNIMDAHNVIDALEHKAYDELGVELVVHCDPIDSGDLTLNRIRHNIKDCIRVFDRASIHDLDIDYEKKEVAFHLRICQHNLKKQHDRLEAILTEAVACVLPDFALKIEYDVIYD